MARRIAIASVPFMLGFTVVFVALGAGSAAIATYIDISRRNAIAGFVLVVLGLVFMGLIPWPERVIGAGLLGRRDSASRTRSSAPPSRSAPRRASAPCSPRSSCWPAAPAPSCAARSLLLFYSLGIGFAFLLAGIAFARAMGAFRWVRDHYTVIRVASGVTLVALGLLLFFGKDWWLHIWLNRALDAVGLGQV